MFQCIGQKRVRRHSNDAGELVRCTNQSETPNNPDKPEWGFLCFSCANSPVIGPRPVEAAAANVGAMQCDAEEYKDQIASGFMSGIAKSDGEEEE